MNLVNLIRLAPKDKIDAFNSCVFRRKTLFLPLSRGTIGSPTNNRVHDYVAFTGENISVYPVRLGVIHILMIHEELKLSSFFFIFLQNSTKDTFGFNT